MESQWNVICELTDLNVLGSNGRSNKLPQKKVRAILIRKDGKIAVMHEAKSGLYALPGGGIEEGEYPTAALVREIFEETGCSCDTIEPLGIVSENRFHADNTRLSYFFVVHTSEENATPHFTEEEISLGTTLEWHTPESALQLIRDVSHHTPQKKFLQAGDLAALNAYSRLQ
jgi:8-oxo-dGTP pyrophosphatase MutT (NUDIX family)